MGGMLIKRQFDYLYRAAEAIRESPNLLDFLRIGAEAYKELVGDVGAVLGADEKNAAWTAQQKARQKLASAEKELRFLETGRVFIEIGNLRHVLGRLESPDRQDLKGRAVSGLDEVYKAFESVLRTGGRVATWRLLESAAALDAALEYVLDAEILLGGYIGPEDVEEGEEILDISFVTVQTPGTVAEKLTGISEIYERVSALAPNETLPLRLIRLESGSLWLRIAGDERVLKVLGTILTVTARFMHGRYSRTGKLAAVPRQIEALTQVLDLREQLVLAGLNVEGMDQPIEHAAAAIAVQASRVIAGEPHVTVGDSVADVGEDQRAQYFEAHRVRRLTDGTE